MPYMDETRPATKCRRCGVYTQGAGYCSKCSALHDEFDGVREYIQLLDYTATLADEFRKKERVK